jgi:bifunctional non-homologous end joining protein LigD
MQNRRFTPAAAALPLPRDIRVAIVSPAARPPDGDGWRHEVKYDGHRIVAILDGRAGLKLISRNGHDRTPLFRALSGSCCRAGATSS